MDKLFRGFQGLAAACILGGVFLRLAPTARAEDFSYVVSGDTVTITGYTGPGGNVTIPPLIGGLPVTAIAGYVFSWNPRLTTISIPSTVTLIGPYAFACSSNLSSIKIPDSTTINDQAFVCCTGLTNVIIGNGLTSIMHAAFAGCTNLVTLVMGNGTTLDTYAFYDCRNLRSVVIPDRVQTIPLWAFGNCFSLTNVTLGPGVRSLGPLCFANCMSLRSIVIPRTVTNIGVETFAACISLSAVYFLGDAPSGDNGDIPFINTPESKPIIYYLPGTIGWGQTFRYKPTAPWVRSAPTILDFGPSFGIQTNRFGFRVSWATNATIAVEASTNANAPAVGWTPVAAKTLANGWTYFSDPGWTNYPARFYRLRSR